MITGKDEKQYLQDIVISALRYSLGRKTYINRETTYYIKMHPELIDERVCIVMLRDIKWYLKDRSNGLIKDDNCDYNTWISLQNWLFKLAKDNKYNVVGYEVR